jgi:hypothetical protein
MGEMILKLIADVDLAEDALDELEIDAHLH